ncbi:MAG: hypothetical protein ACR2HJ_03185 [Fimbriimonadales bacterium]
MKLFALLSVLLAAIFVASCGGSGGGGGGGGGGPYSSVRVELPGRDPLNIVVGETVRFELAGYDEFTGERDVLQATSWSILDNPNVGTINANGQFTAALPGNARIAATWNGTPPAMPLRITVRPQGLARLTGTVRNASGGAGVGGVQVIFFNQGNAEVGRATTMSNGTFLAQVPTTATTMNLAENTLSGRWLKQWEYRGMVYQAGNSIPNCHATFVVSNPPLNGGETDDIPDPLRVFSLGTPPPFPDGCK